ncbi:MULTISPECIES: peptidoglycan -binding protein [Thioclava]|uniref:peptidoglycan -binding protein n=1 Tax=Thioclava TaxID=285107 RepID=UPI000B53E2FF|nr:MULTISPECIES: peptidoglycan -binding protein [Thioclava]OWY04718.1 flagellar motor protein MotB [Thioclava sp. F1Mire-8]OWY06346.1 flagellar motor protein MotB [Thioclava sp. IC9]OWY07944.1 flagellar motor protein MotB [Thioclava sp. F42-5]OWY15109.1 flagellar motor protein MotB [Thioclava sp. F34-6]OWY18749.1 flagellar motor protein MotB [Thioclava sp. JM3]
MALARRGGNRFSTNIWPGFVDAMTALLLVLMFVLSIFMIVQSVLRDTLSTKEGELIQLNEQVSNLAKALSLQQTKTQQLTGELENAKDKADQQDSLIATLTSQLDDRKAALADAKQKITEFEARVAQLVGERNAAQQDASAKADEIRLSKETIADLRDKLTKSGDEVAAMTLQLEEARKKAEDTLTKLAAAQTAKADLEKQLGKQLSEAEKQAALKATAQKALADQQAISEGAQKKVALLNQQVAALRSQLAQLQNVLDEAQQKDAEAKVQLDNLGQQLNAALARAASEEKKRADLQEKLRKEAEAKAKDLQNYRSEFFGKLSQLLKGKQGVKVEGDRFVFSSEVLFAPASATLSDAGRAQIKQVTALLDQLRGEIPSDIPWIIRVDGHTDDTPLSGQGEFKDNWELSQARALSVVKYMVDSLGFPPDRLAAAGFAQFDPVNTADTPEARAQNRRIELKLTER